MCENSCFPLISQKGADYSRLLARDDVMDFLNALSRNRSECEMTAAVPKATTGFLTLRVMLGVATNEATGPVSVHL